MPFVSMPIYVSSKAFGRSRVYCKRITFGNVFFLAPLAVDIPSPNQVHRLLCIHKGINSWIWIKRQIKSTINSRKFKVRQIWYPPNEIHLQYVGHPWNLRWWLPGVLYIFWPSGSFLFRFYDHFSFQWQLY